MKRVLFIVLMLSLFSVSANAKTVNYNDPNVSKEVNTLRKFRDFHLKKSKAGMAFIEYYYEYGPIAADAIRKRERLKSLIRLCLLPLMYAGKNFTGVMIALKILLALVAAIITWYAYIRIKKVPIHNKRVPVVY